MESTRTTLPDWHATLKATSFADGQAKFRNYLQNAEESIAKAGTDPRDEDLFWETKYSSAAGQYGYLAAMMLVDGFLATYLKHRPMDGLLGETQQIPNNWEALQTSGLGGKMAYNRLLKLVFGGEINRKFNDVHDKLHVIVHYTLDSQKDNYIAGLEHLLAFEKLFTEKAKQLLEAQGIDDWA